jgi:steroid delta-isomerase-like uncharacterized protein
LKTATGSTRFSEAVGPGYVNHIAPPGVDVEGGLQALDMFKAAFPDLSVSVEEQVAEGGTVATRYTMRGTHRGAFQGIAPTGRTVALGGVSMHRVADGRIVEDWLGMDMMGLLQQLGAGPGEGSG